VPMRICQAVARTSRVQLCGRLFREVAGGLKLNAYSGSSRSTIEEAPRRTLLPRQPKKLFSTLSYVASPIHDH